MESEHEWISSVFGAKRPLHYLGAGRAKAPCAFRAQSDFAVIDIVEPAAYFVTVATAISTK